MRKEIWWRVCEEGGSMVLGREFVGKSVGKGVGRREFKEEGMEERV